MIKRDSKYVSTNSRERETKRGGGCVGFGGQRERGGERVGLNQIDGRQRKTIHLWGSSCQC